MPDAPVMPDAGESPIGSAVPVVETPVAAEAAHLHLVTPVPPETPKAAPVTPPAKEDPTRFEYHQRRADMAEGKAKQLEPLAELGRRVAENPEMMALLSGRTAAPEAPKVAPVAPAKPAGYNDEDAFNDPRSESYKYRIARDEYRDQMLATILKRDEEREARRQEQERARHEAELVQQNTLALKAQLQHQYGFTGAQADDMIATLGDPAAVQVPTLVKLYKVIVQDRMAAQGKGGAAPPANLGPVPAPILGGESRAPMTEGENFNAALMRYKRK